MTNLESILKSWDITLMPKVHIVKAMVFPVVIYRYDSWTVKKAEHQRTDAFKLWCWRRLLKPSWTARRSDQILLLIWPQNKRYSTNPTFVKIETNFLNFSGFCWSKYLLLKKENLSGFCATPIMINRQCGLLWNFSSGFHFQVGIKFPFLNCRVPE